MSTHQLYLPSLERDGATSVPAQNTVNLGVPKPLCPVRDSDEGRTPPVLPNKMLPDLLWQPCRSTSPVNAGRHAGSAGNCLRLLPSVIHERPHPLGSALEEGPPSTIKLILSEVNLILQNITYTYINK